MNHTAPTHGSAIRSIPPNRLVIAPVNVRKTPPVVIADAEMTASIAAHGLLENLVVRSDGPDSDYAVVAGGRRFIGASVMSASTNNCSPATAIPGRSSKTGGLTTTLEGHTQASADRPP